MVKPASVYRKLSGKKRRLLGFSQLWHGQDHLLLVKSNRVTEEYRRFSFADIQAIVVTRSADQTLLQAGAAVAALAWLLMVTVVSSIFAKVFFGVTGAAAVALAIADKVRGPRCRCELYTAVSREPLTPISRVRQAEAFLARLQPEIEAVQGVRIVDPVAADPTAAGPIAIESPRSEPIVPPPQEIAKAPGYLPEILFGFFLVDAILFQLAARYPQSQMAGALLTTVFGEVALGIVALFRRRKTDPRRATYAIIVIALLCIGRDGFEFASGLMTWFFSAIEAGRQGSEIAQDFWTPPASIAWFATVWRVALAFMGGFVSFMERRIGASP